VLSDLPPLRVPEELRYEEVELPLHPHLTISKARVPYRNERLDAKLCFAYEGRMFAAFDPARGFSTGAGRRFYTPGFQWRRSAACSFLDQLGLKQRAPPTRIPRRGGSWRRASCLASWRALVEAGWDIEAERKEYSGAQAHSASKFEWRGLVRAAREVEYGEHPRRALPELLEALRRADKMVRLDDGTYGVLPEEWLPPYWPAGWNG